MTAGTKASLSCLAHRVQALDVEIAELDEKIESLLFATAPELLGLNGVGPDTAAALLVTAGDNPERLHSEAAWAHLCGVSPIQAASGKNAWHLRLHTVVATARPTTRALAHRHGPDRPRSRDHFTTSSDG